MSPVPPCLPGFLTESDQHRTVRSSFHSEESRGDGSDNMEPPVMVAQRGCFPEILKAAATQHVLSDYRSISDMKTNYILNALQSGSVTPGLHCMLIGLKGGQDILVL
ncbi:hypothetical protein CRENBAI_023622 [Crenichthys baileyi]|uniref:Uncharacterized protein n=1 Tax=Crenichthys baileyi TaxID=28760 RepID=A0AAV9SH21_9TELE